MFYFYTFIYSLKIYFKPEFHSSAKHKRYFEEGGKPNSCWSTVFPTVKVNVDQQLFGYPHSSKYLITDVNHQMNVYQGRCWPNGCPKQDFIVVPPPSNIMEVKNKTYHRGQNRTLIKYKSK